MHKWFLPVVLFCSTTVRAQYYYNDIVSNRTARENFIQLKKAGVKEVTVASFNPDSQPTEGFSVKQKVSSRNNTVETVSQSAYSNPSILTSVYTSDGWPVSATDSTDASVSRVSYSYSNDAAHQLTTIASTTGFPGENSNLYNEIRTYTYSGTNPASMKRVKNGKDTLHVSFLPEEHGWIGEERWMQKGKLIETYFYYYDDKGRLTDVAHYNKQAQKILPDYTFEYNGAGRISSMMTVVEGTNQYRTWRYTYDERGLKTGEVVFNKYKQREGRLTYTYE